MIKNFNFRKHASGAALAAVLVGSFGVTAAAINDTNDASVEASATTSYAVTIEGRDDAASRSADRVEATPALHPAEALEMRIVTAQAEAADLDHYRIANANVQNGRLDTADLCKLSWTQKSYVRCDAANAFEHLNAAFKAEFGHDIDITDSYRSYEFQVEVKAKYGKLAAVPGYSNHGYAIALDLGSNIPQSDSAEYQWMAEHAAEFGWVNPTFTDKVEPWHWEFHGII